MRASRLLTLLLLLKVERSVTARELAERLEVTERTIYRDMEALSAAGVPVVADRGPRGGWRLLEPYRTQVTGLSLEEAQALVVPPPSGLPSALGLGEAAEGALTKLLAGLPAAHRRRAEMARERLYVDVAAWRGGDEEPRMLPKAQEAVWLDRKARLHYQRNDGETVERLIDPLGLVAKGTGWYLIAAVEGEPRTFRISRIQSLEMLDEPSIRPPGFDLGGYWKRSAREFVATLPSYEITVRASSTVMSRLRFSARFGRLLEAREPDAEGWTQARLVFDTEEAACEWALGWGPDVRVLEPQCLREMVLERAAATLAVYRPWEEADALDHGGAPAPPPADAPR